VLRRADVVVCTCSAAAESRLASRTFHFLLIDEAAQALEPEAVIPFTNGIQQAVLVGDHKQLGSIVPTRQLQAAGVARQRGGGRPRTCAVRTCSVSREGPGTRRGVGCSGGVASGRGGRRRGGRRRRQAGCRRRPGRGAAQRGRAGRRGGRVLRRTTGRLPLIVLPQPLHQQPMFRFYHNRQGHFGVQKTAALLSERFFWKSPRALRDEVAAFIRRCPTVK